MSQVDVISAVFLYHMSLSKRSDLSSWQGSVEITHDLRQNLSKSHFDQIRNTPSSRISSYPYQSLYRITSYHVTSHHVTPHLITLHHTTSHQIYDSNQLHCLLPCPSQIHYFRAASDTEEQRRPHSSHIDLHS